jgi:plastocyanin
MARNLALLALAALALAAPSVAHAATVTVQITRVAYVPDSVKVKVGDTVTWTNADTANHQVLSRAGGFTSPVLTPGAQFSYTFTKEGRFGIEDPLQQRPRLRMTVEVEAAPPTVSLAIAPLVQTYGSGVTLTGRVSTGAANERVTIFGQACGAAFVRVGEATTTTGGAWTLAVKPTKSSSYRVEWRAASSPVVAVRMRPRLRLTRLAPKRFSLRATAAVSFAGKTAAVQRYDAALKRWVRVRVVTLRPLTGAVAPAVGSGLTFRASVPARSRLRIVMVQAQVGACYLPGTSNTVVS